MLKLCEEILAMSDDEINKELYSVLSTFGVSNPTQPNVIADFIKNQSKNLFWYRDNGYPDVALAVLEYITGYSLFYYGMHKPSRYLFEFLFEVMNQDYYRELGFPTTYYDPQTQRFNQNAINSRIEGINANARQEFPNVNFLTKNLNYETLLRFCYSFIWENPVPELRKIKQEQAKETIAARAQILSNERDHRAV